MPPIKYPLKTKNKSTPTVPISLKPSIKVLLVSGNNKKEQWDCRTRHIAKARIQSKPKMRESFFGINTILSMNSDRPDIRLYDPVISDILVFPDIPLHL